MQITRLEARIRGWRSRIVKLTVKAEAAGHEANFTDRQMVDDLKARCALTQLKIDALKAARP